MRVYFSNRIEILFEALKGLLYSNTTPFTKRCLVVPSPAMKSWISSMMAKNSELGIFAGIRILYLEQAIQEITNELSLNPDLFPNRISEFHLSIKLGMEMTSLLKTYPTMTGTEKEVWNPLVSYLSSKTSLSIGQKEEKRLLTLSRKLAGLFLLYGKYGNDMLREWPQNDHSPLQWQQKLWKRTNPKIYPEEFEWKKKDVTFHFFGLSFIPKQFHRCFLDLSKTTAVHYYLLSPCHVFWNDIVSDNKSQNLIAFWEEQGASDAQQIALEEYLYDRNPLLANWGRLGREMAIEIEQSSIDFEGLYSLPESVQYLKTYSELLSDDLILLPCDRPPTILELVQTDFLLMRKPTAETKICLSEDDSIQLYLSSSLMREVQTLYDLLCRLIEKHSQDKDPIKPEDVIIMAPDITPYVPFIRAVFQSKESVFTIQLLDLASFSQTALVRGFLTLMTLAQGRWELSTVLELFENPEFQNKQQLSEEDLKTLKRWMESSGVFWGKDHSHRQEFFEKEYEGFISAEEEALGTWEKGLERLLMGTIMTIREGSLSGEMPIFPLNLVDHSETALFSKWLQIMQSLKEDLQLLNENQYATLEDWSLYLSCLAETYLITEETPQELKEPLFSIFRNFSSHEELKTESVSFSTIQYHLNCEIEKVRLNDKESSLNALRFCSMLPMRALPAKVVVLLGMGEENYPRSGSNDTLNLLKKSKKADYTPSQSDFDRYLFLETLLSARQYFILSYVDISKDDGKEMSSSLLVSELMQYLDLSFTINGKTPSEILLKKTPFSPYDKALFEKGSPFKSYSKFHYEASKALYEKEGKQERKKFLDQFTKQTINFANHPGRLSIPLSHLSKAAKNPIDMYLRQKLGIYLKFPNEEENKDEEALTLHPKEKFLFRKEALKTPLELLLESSKKQGKLPLGPFGMLSMASLKQESDFLKQQFSDLEIEPQSLFEIKFSSGTASTEALNELPSFQHLFFGQKLEISGVFPHICPKGMISLSEGKPIDIVKIWPEYLLFLCMRKKWNLNVGDQLIFPYSKKIKKPFFEDPFLHLENYLCYYFYALNDLSPLIPEWIPEILAEDHKKFEEKIKTTFSEKNLYFYNDAFKWILRGSPSFDPAIIFTHWKPIAEKLFAEMFSHWK